MQRSRWLLGVFACLLATFVLGQVPGTIPPVKMPQFKPPVKTIPGVSGALEARQPFIAQYVYCNALQLYESRPAVWEPVYRVAGASDAEIKTHDANLVDFIKVFCGNGPAEEWQVALDRIEAFDDLTDERTAKALGVSLSHATSLRLSRLLGNIERFQRDCLGGQEAGALRDRLAVVGSLLPSTLEPPGLALPRKGLSTTFGKCGASPSSGLSGSYASLDRTSLSQCISNALAQTSTCDSPVGDGPSGEPIRRDRREGRCVTAGGEDRHCSGGHNLLYANGSRTEVSIETDEYTNSETGRRTHIVSESRTSYDKEGNLVGDEETTTVDGVVVQEYWGYGEPRSDAQVRADRTGERLPLTEPEGFRLVTRKYSLGDNVSVIEVALERVETTSTSPSGRDCRSVNPGSASPLGLSRIAVGAAGGDSPVRAGRLNTFDLIGQCMCTSLGRFGPQLAHQAGFSCGPDENSRRLDCLLNPSGPADGIRPECVEFLHADNPDRDSPRALNEWCGRVAQCPPGAGIATTSGSLGAMCSCGSSLARPSGSGGGTPGGGRCAAVRCAGGAGAAGSDLYRECCGGAPGDLPSTPDPAPSSPVPRPGVPGELPKQQLPGLLKQPLPKVPMQPLPDKSKLPPPPPPT